VKKAPEEPCKRLYTLGKRLKQSDQRRTAILAAARGMLESQGYLNLTIDSVARQSGVSRQTVHNLFKTKSGLLEAVFDQLALRGGMERMGEVMQLIFTQTDPVAMLGAYVQIFTDFWSKDRLLIGRIHGIATLDPLFGKALEARNQRRRGSAAKVIDHIARLSNVTDKSQNPRIARVLYAMTSFEFFNVLVEATGSEEEAADALTTHVNALVAQWLQTV
jgi:AcrR family transcriptional regulator